MDTFDDKCPTCPNYGTGKYCDCGRSEQNKTMGTLLIILIASIIIAFAIGLNT